MSTWEEAKHPRRKNGEFGNADWAKKISDKIGKDVGGGGGVKAAKKPRVKKPLLLKGADVVKHVPSDDRTDLGPHEMKAIDSYTSAGYEDMNGTLRHGSDHELIWLADQAEVDQNVQSLDSVFNKMPPLKHSIQVQRGIVQSDNLFGPVGSRVGKVFNDKGYVSTTWHHNERYGSADRTTEGKAEVTITVPAGAKAFRPWTHGVMGDREGEVLLPRNQRFKVVSDKMKSLVRHIELELLA